MKCQDLFSLKNKKKYKKLTSAAVVIGALRVNPFMPSGLSYLSFLDRSIFSSSDVWLFFIITIISGNSCF